MITPDDLGRMFGVADDRETLVIVDVGVRAGLLWRCTWHEAGEPECGYVNPARDETCGDCGEPRP